MADVLAYRAVVDRANSRGGLDLRTCDEARKLGDLHHKSQVTL